MNNKPPAPKKAAVSLESLYHGMKMDVSSPSRASVEFNATESQEEFQIVHESETTLILRRQRLGKKVLMNKDYSSEKIFSILEHERRVSMLLPGCSVRKVNHLDSYKGCYAFNFDWVEGITLGTWLHSFDNMSDKEEEKSAAQLEVGVQQGHDVLTTRLHVAIAVAKAVASIHEAGVAHADITPDNIIISFKSNKCLATLIDLSKSVILSEKSAFVNEDNQEAFTERMKIDDMRALGLILYLIFGGNDALAKPGDREENKSVESATTEGGNENRAPKDSSNDDSSGFKRGRKSKVPSLPSHIPLYLISLVSTLIAPSINDRGQIKYQYKNARDVYNDLHIADIKPEIYLVFNQASEMASKTLMTPKDVFYGRLTEAAMVKQSLELVMNSRGHPVIMAVSGDAGAGKTSLLQRINKPITESNGFVIRCSFDRTASPDTAIVSALNTFFGNLLYNDNQCTKESIKGNIRESLGSHIHVLLTSIPKLQAFMDDDVSSVFSDDEIFISTAEENRRQQLKFLLSKLICAISRESHPVALLFEDLHWSNSDALDTIRTIMVDRNICYCSYFVSFRDDNAAITLDITQMIEAVKVQGIQLFSVRLGPIDKQAVKSLVSETLCAPPSLCQSLSSLIYSKTGGIILFCISLLKSLQENEHIRFSLSTCRWEFDLRTICDENIPSDIVKHLGERIMRLPESLQMGLQIAAILGSSFDVENLEKAHPVSPLELDRFLSTVVDGGFLLENYPTRGLYSWNHDKLREAAYSLISPEQRDSLHLLIGTRIFLKTESNKIHHVIHDIVKNMNRGAFLLSDSSQKIKLAELNVLAGENANRESAFYSAEDYFHKGVELLDHDWVTHTYDLGMNLFNSALQASSVTGNAHNFNSLINMPLMAAKCFEDRLPSYYHQVRFLALSGCEGQAFEQCLAVLGQFGEALPTTITPELIYKEIVKTKVLLSNYSMDDLVSFPKLEKRSIKYWQIKMWKLAMFLSLHLNNMCMPLIGAKIVQISIACGWCPDSAYGLFSHGQSLISVMKNIPEGYYWSKLAVSLLKQFRHARAHIPVLNCLHHAFVSYWKEPIQAVSAVLIDTHQEALIEGQTEFSILCAMNSCRLDLMGGQNLEKAYENCLSLAKKMMITKINAILLKAQQKQQWAVGLFVSHQLTVLKLRGIDDSRPFDLLPDDINNENDLLKDALSKGRQNLKDVIHFYRFVFSSFWFKQYDEVTKYPSHGRVVRFLDIYHVFYEGLAALHLARTSDRDVAKWTETGEKAVALFRIWEGHCKWNFQNMYLLLAAELHFLRAEHIEAQEKYKASIISAYTHNFLHEEGLAMELLGMFYNSMGKKKEAEETLMGARVCYERWGAVALLPQLDAVLSSP